MGVDGVYKFCSYFLDEIHDLLKAVLVILALYNITAEITMLGPVGRSRKYEPQIPRLIAKNENKAVKQIILFRDLA